MLTASWLPTTIFVLFLNLIRSYKVDWIVFSRISRLDLFFIYSTFFLSFLCKYLNKANLSLKFHHYYHFRTIWYASWTKKSTFFGRSSKATKTKRFSSSCRSVLLSSFRIDWTFLKRKDFNRNWIDFSCVRHRSWN